MKTVNVEIAGREYTIKELPSRKNADWRKLLEAETTKLTSLVADAPSVQLNAAGVGELLRRGSDLLLGSVDNLTDLLFAYSPELEKDQDYISENAYDSELIGAFKEVVGLAYPFGINSTLSQLVQIGLENSQTSPKSPSANGEDGMTNFPTK